ncbi:MAG: tetratricopeptide repeat protein [bacterium]|nr:tetratricopeptide repeat protein [bacterium]
MSKLTWLHLSDWHQKDEKFDRKVVRNALIADIKNRSAIHAGLEKIDFIVFSGDLAWKGKKSQLQEAEKNFLAPVRAAAGVDKDRLFMVPGNHDLDRELFDMLPAALTKPLKDEAVKEWLDNGKKRQKVLEPFEAYAEFAEAYGGNFSLYAGSTRFDAGERKVALVGLNSALMCGRDTENPDYGKLVLGEPQVYDALKTLEGADLRIVVMHHPFNWLTIGDIDNVEGRLREGADFILAGHQHRGCVSVEQRNGENCIVIHAGAAYVRRDKNNSYNFVHIDAAENCTVFLRCWSEKIKKWRQDVDASEVGFLSFPLGKSAPSPTGPVGHVGHVRTETSRKDTAVAGKERPAGFKYNLKNPVFNVPYLAKGAGMVGREEVLQKVRAQLSAGKRTAIGHTAAFQGLGGLGKTQLAVEYAYRFRSQYAGGVIWIQADADIEPQLIRLAKEAKWIAPETEHAVILQVATRRLNESSDCLVVFDNVESLEEIKPYFPGAGARPHLLLTSRTPQPGFQPVAMALLDGKLSLELLLKESGRERGTLPADELEAAQEIADLLSGLPLAIEIAGAYLNYVPGCSFANYRAMMDTNLKEAMKGDFYAGFTGHESNLNVTLQVSKGLSEKAPLLEEILDILAWSGNTFMGISLLAAIMEKEEGELYHSLGMGVSLHLLQKDPETDRYDIHRLLRSVRREQAPISGMKDWVSTVCSRLGDWFEGIKNEFTRLPVFEAEIDHLQVWLRHVEPYGTNESARLTWLQAYPPYHWGKYREIQKQVQAAFSIMAGTGNPDKKLEANILNDLGFTHNVLGNYTKALEYHQQALNIRREIFGEKHVDTANSLNSVGSTYASLGNKEDALKYQEQALKIRSELFGEMHFYTAFSIDHVGNAYGHLGNHKEALKYEEQALKIRRELFGETHPDTATSLDNVGTTYGNLGNYKEALKHHEQALDIRRKLFGEMHPDTATSIDSIAATYFNIKNLKKALDYFKMALTIRLQVLGDQHPNTAVSVNNVVVCLIELTKFREASELLEEHLAKLSKDHPKYAFLSDLKKRIPQIIIEKPKSAFPSKKKKKKK